MYRNLYPKSSFFACPYTVLVKRPVRFYSIFDEIGQNVDGKMYFYHRSHCSTTTTESNGSRHGSLFGSLAPAKGYAQKNCAERFSALKPLVAPILVRMGRPWWGSSRGSRRTTNWTNCSSWLPRGLPWGRGWLPPRCRHLGL